MRLWHAFRAELAHFNKNVLFRATFIVLLLIPFLYSGLFLGAFYDPYGRLEDLPVAFVNEDEGWTWNGTTLHIGDDLEERLLKDKKFDWHVVSEKEARIGLEDGQYYFAVIVPADFSKRATTVLDPQPLVPELIYEPNEGYNFLAAQIGKSGAVELRTQVADALRKVYIENLFSNIDQLAVGFASAHEGSVKLKDGAERLQSGLATLNTNLSTFQQGARDVQTGASSIAQGAQTLNQSIQAYVQGIQQLEGGAQKFAKGLNDVAAGGTSLQTGMQKIQQAGQSLDEKTATLASAMTDVVNAWQTLVEQSPDLAQSEAAFKLLKQTQALEAGLNDLHGGVHMFATQLDQWAKGYQSMQQGIDTLKTNWTPFYAGITKLSGEGPKLVEGSSDLARGATALKAGTEKLAGGSKELKAGAEALEAGAQSLADGASELATRLGEAKARTQDASLRDTSVEMITRPVQLVDRVVHEVPNYGTGFAPYFLSLSLYIGALILSVVYGMREDPFQHKLRKRGEALALFGGKTLTILLIGVLQAVITLLAVRYVVGITVDDPLRYMVFGILTSITFMTLIQFLVTWLDQAGRFLAVVLLILQLTTSAGTFPLQLIPHGYQVFHPFLPMSYTVLGFKAVISTGNMSDLSHASWVLVYWIVGTLLLTLLYFVTRVPIRSNHSFGKQKG